MEFQQLRYFVKAAELRSFTRAAAECGVTQPSLSQQIIKLEEELGQPLFERTGRRVELTEAGERFARRARQILELSREAQRELTDDGQTGRLKLAAIPTIAPYYLPGLVQRFRQVAPLAQIEIQEEVTEVALKKLQEGEIDVAVLALPLKVQHLVVEPLFEEELFLVLSADHRLAEAPRIELNDVAGEPFLLLSEAHCLSDQVATFCQQRHLQPIQTSRLAQLTTVLELVALGEGISFIPEMARRTDFHPQRVYRSVAPQPPQRTIALAWNDYRYQTRLLKTLLDLIRTGADESAT